MPRSSKPASPTAQFLDRAITFSGLNQREIADRVGFPKPNIISMMKVGDTKIPIDRIPALAKVCGVDPAEFVAVAMREYQPEVWDVLTGALGTYLEPDEVKLVNAFRIAGMDRDLEITKELSEMLLMLFVALGKEERSDAEPEPDD